MLVKDLRPDLLDYIDKHNLSKKWLKISKYLETNIKHRSLNTELLEPKWKGIYSFRIDQKYRGLFFIDNNGDIEIFAITNHYK